MYWPQHLQTNKQSIPLLLDKIKKQKINSYIKFKAQTKEKDYRKIYKIYSLLSKLHKRRQTQAMLRLIKCYFHHCQTTTPVSVLSELGNDFSNSQVTKDRLIKTNKNQKLKTINVSYLKLRMNYDGAKSVEFSKQKQLNGQATKKESINGFSKANRYSMKEYRFESVDSIWRREIVKIK